MHQIVFFPPRLFTTDIVKPVAARTTPYFALSNMVVYSGASGVPGFAERPPVYITFGMDGNG